MSVNRFGKLSLSPHDCRCQQCKGTRKRWRRTWQNALPFPMDWSTNMARSAFSEAARSVEKAEALVRFLKSCLWPTEAAEAILAENVEISQLVKSLEREDARLALIASGANRYVIARYHPRQRQDKKWIWWKAFDVCDTFRGEPIGHTLADRISHIGGIKVNSLHTKLLTPGELYVYGCELWQTESDSRPAEMIPEDYYAL